MTPLVGAESPLHAVGTATPGQLGTLVVVVMMQPPESSTPSLSPSPSVSSRVGSVSVTGS
jgi:hypothetical protein